MDSLFILIPIALVFVFIAVKIFLWSVKSGQYEDLETEGRRILFEEKRPKNKSGEDSVKKDGQNENPKESPKESRKENECS